MRTNIMAIILKKRYSYFAVIQHIQGFTKAKCQNIPPKISGECEQMNVCVKMFTVKTKSAVDAHWSMNRE